MEIPLETPSFNDMEFHNEVSGAHADWPREMTEIQFLVSQNSHPQGGYKKESGRVEIEEKRV